MARDLTNHVCIITGASSGIGAATALACAHAGMDVVLNARRAEKLDEVAARVTGGGRRAIVVAGDVTEPDLSARLLDAADEHFGRFDAVFANAGYGVDGPIHRTTDASLRHMFEVNFFAGVDLLRIAAQTMLERNQRGHLAMCSSCLAKFTLCDGGVYCASKAAQNHVCRAMHMELRPKGISVFSVHPIGTATEFFETSARLKSGAGDTPHGFKDPPRLFLQPPSRVANAVVRNFRRRSPRPEVWTSVFMRLFSALTDVSPRLTDVLVTRFAP